MTNFNSFIDNTFVLAYVMSMSDITNKKRPPYALQVQREEQAVGGNSVLVFGELWTFLKIYRKTFLSSPPRESEICILLQAQQNFYEHLCNREEHVDKDMRGRLLAYSAIMCKERNLYRYHKLELNIFTSIMLASLIGLTSFLSLGLYNTAKAGIKTYMPVQQSIVESQNSTK